jgi:hypothetical protein
MIATAMSVYGNVGQAQAKTMTQRIGAPNDSNSNETSESSSKQNAVAQSVLESFEKTQQRH